MSKAKGSRKSGKNPHGSLVRVWPSMVKRGIWLGGIVLGVVVAVAALVTGNWFVAPLGALFVFLSIRLVGWVEISDDTLTDQRLIGDTVSVMFSDVREVGLGMHQVRNSKSWYPEIETLDGNSVKLLSLKSYSGTETITRIEKIFSTCMAMMPEEEEDQFTTVTQSEDGELEFELSPGYDAYLREKANAAEEDQVAAPEPVQQQPQPSVPTSRRAPHLTLVDSTEAAEPAEDAPEVFTPKPMVERRKKKQSLTVVKEGFVERAEAALRAEALSKESVPTEQKLVPLPLPANVSKLPAVVIEQPATPAAEAEVANEPETQFTSLFRRSAA